MDLLRIVPIKNFILISFYLRTNISAKYLKVDCYKDYEWVKKNIFFSNHQYKQFHIIRLHYFSYFFSVLYTKWIEG